MTTDGGEACLQPGEYVDSGAPAIVAFARQACGDAADDITKAVRLYYAVRDGIVYTPYCDFRSPETFRASACLSRGAGFCVAKAALLAAAARAAGIPARVGFADVRNHLTTPKLRQLMGSDTFYYHGYTELYLAGKWVKATPAFDRRLCEKFGVRPLEFDGREDSLFHPYDVGGRRHMEYIRDRGPAADVPVDEILATFRRYYPKLTAQATSAPATQFLAEAEQAQGEPSGGGAGGRQAGRDVQAPAKKAVERAERNIFKTMAVRSLEEATRSIPVIDFARAFWGEPEGLDAVAGEVRHACESVGFFYLAGHGVPQEIVDAAFEASREFHAIPPDEKMRLALNENNIGYLAPNQSMQRASTVHKATRPNYNESFFISHDRGADHPDVVAGTPLRGRNQWPEGHERMRAAMLAYFKTLEGVGERMLPVLARSLDMPAGYFRPFFDNEAHVNLRFLHYPPQESDDPEQFGQGPHTDNSFITILARQDVPGLAVRLPSGEWLAPPVIPGTFLVNLGNVMKRWSNDRFLSTPHGVLNDSGTDRYSIAFFYSPNPDAVLECLPSCAGADNPPRYPPAVYRDLVLEFYNANYFHRQGYAAEGAR